MRLAPDSFAELHKRQAIANAKRRRARARAHDLAAIGNVAVMALYAVLAVAGMGALLVFFLGAGMALVPAFVPI